MGIKIKSELEFSRWFEKNFKNLGFDRIIKRDDGRFPDFILERKGKEIRVELETLSSNFILHKHDPSKVDEVICIKNDFEIGLPTSSVKSLDFIGGKKRLSATVEKSTVNIIDALIKTRKYRISNFRNFLE